MRYRTLTIIFTLLSTIFCGEALAQRMPERHLVRKGNRQYERAKYDESIDNYSRALQKDPNCFEAKFNTANVQMQKELYEKAEQTLRKLAQDSTRTELERGDVSYNLGNALFAQQKLEEALDCYRNAMRMNPDDVDAKHNYALTKLLLQQQQDQQQQDQNNQNNQDNQNQDQQQQNQDQQQQNQDQKEQEQNQDNQDQKDQQEQQQPEPQISEQEQQAMLEAIQAQEDKTQDKLKEKKGVIIRGGKNW